MSFVGQVVWDTEPVFFFLWAFCFFPRARVIWWKKRDEKYRKKSTWPNSESLFLACCACVHCAGAAPGRSRARDPRLERIDRAWSGPESISSQSSIDGAETLIMRASGVGEVALLDVHVGALRNEVRLIHSSSTDVTFRLGDGQLLPFRPIWRARARARVHCAQSSESFSMSVRDGIQSQQVLCVQLSASLPGSRWRWQCQLRCALVWWPPCAFLSFHRSFSRSPSSTKPTCSVIKSNLQAKRRHSACVS